MKNRAFELQILFFTISLISFSCNNENSHSQVKDTTIVQQKDDKVKDYEKDLLWNHLHITPNEIFTNADEQKKMSFASLNPVSKKEFFYDSSRFGERYYNQVQPYFKENLLKIGVYEMYHNMQRILKLQDIIMPNQTPTTYTGIRVYPAIEKNKTGINNFLYLILVGEISNLETNDIKYILMNDASTPFWSVKNGMFARLSAGLPKNKAIQDIHNYWDYWKSLNTDPTRPVKLDSSFTFTISEYYEMLGGSYLGIYDDIRDQNSEGGIILYPCINPKYGNLYFVAKGIQTSSSKSPYIIREDLDFFNHMDECPSACPTNEIH